MFVRFLIRRLLLAVPTLLGICVLTFAMIHLAPGDPLEATAGTSPVPLRLIEAQRRIYFLDLPVFFNGHPRGLEAREARILQQLRSSSEPVVASGKRAALACDTLCLPAFEQAARDAASSPLLRQRLLALFEQLRSRHGSLGDSERPMAWAAQARGKLAAEVIEQLVETAGADERAWQAVAGRGLAALPAAMRVLLDGDGRAQQLASEVVSELSGSDGRLGGDQSADRVLADWREWWFQQRRHHERFGGWQRLVGHVTETQFGYWIGRLLRLQFGHSLHDSQPVGTKLARALPITLLLSFLAMLFAYLVAVPLGVYAAVRRGTRLERCITVATFLLYSMPSFWVAMMLILLFGGVGLLDWFPIYGLHSAGMEAATGLSWLADRALHLVMPVFCLSYALTAVISRYQRGAMLEVLQQDYIRTARAKGLSERTVILKHGLRNALLPTITLLGLHFPFLIGGSVIIERIFNIPGMGLLTFEAFLNRDYPVIMALSVISAAMTLLGIILADLLYAVADPRIALAGGTEPSGSRRGS